MPVPPSVSNVVPVGEVIVTEGVVARLEKEISITAFLWNEIPCAV